MSNLIENIASNDLVKAKKIFEARMNQIRDQKLYESKRCLAADISEAVGGLTAAQIQARKEMGWRKASDVLPDPRDRDIQLPEPKKVKVVKKKKLREEDSSFRSSVEAEKKRLQKKHPSLISKMKKQKEKEKEQPRDASAMVSPEQPRDASAMVSPEQPKTDTPSSKRSFGKMVKQNINTFSGRDKDTPFVTKDHEGQTGRVLRTVVKGLAAMGRTGE